MSILSRKMSFLKPSPTLAMAQKARQLQKEGVDVISLSAGEPDFPVASSIVEAAQRALDQGLNKYTDVGGIPELKKAIAEKFSRENALSYTPQEIIVTVGAKQALFHVMMATLDPGDEVIIPAPYWVSYVDMVRLNQATPVIIECPETQGFKLTPEDLQKALTPQSKWIILNSPNNPTGAVYAESELKALADVIRSHPTVGVVSDDIYEHILYTGTPFQTMAQVAPDLKYRVLTINGLSKAYAMTGWRLGYAAGESSLIRALTDLQSQSTSNPNSIAQWAAVEALQGPQDFIKDQAHAFQKRRDYVVTKLNSFEGIRCSQPEGAFYAFADCRALLGRQTPQGKTVATDTDLSLYLLDEAKVAVVPGEAFGAPGYLRLSYATDLSTLKTALGRLEEGLRRLSRPE